VGGFSLGKNFCLGNIEFIFNYFGGLSLLPRRGDSGAAFMGSTRSGTPSPRWSMIEDSAEEFLTASSGEGVFGLPSPRMCDTGAPPAPVTTTTWMENAPATQATTTVSPWMAAARPNTDLPFMQCHTRHAGGGGQQAQARARQPTTEQEAVPQRSKLTGKQAATAVQSHAPPRHDPALKAERILMVDFASTQAWAKEVAQPASREGGGGGCRLRLLR
jgi:hypothetical protein